MTTLEQKTLQPISFDGGEGPAKWEECGVPKGVIPDQHVEHCEGGGINLNVYRIGWYPNCSGCGRMGYCREQGANTGEQVEGN